ncbi:hypothetical protein BDV18DRAFT_109724 [Aspergillus unguis]
MHLCYISGYPAVPEPFHLSRTLFQSTLSLSMALSAEAAIALLALLVACVPGLRTLLQCCRRQWLRSSESNSSLLPLSDLPHRGTLSDLPLPRYEPDVRPSSPSTTQRPHVYPVSRFGVYVNVVAGSEGLHP